MVATRRVFVAGTASDGNTVRGALAELIDVKKTRYFAEQVLRKRPYIEVEWCAKVVAQPIRRQSQPNGRVRFWGRVVDPRDGRTRILRVVTLDDGETVHNAFFDRGFREDPS